MPRNNPALRLPPPAAPPSPSLLHGVRCQRTLNPTPNGMQDLEHCLNENIDEEKAHSRMETEVMDCGLDPVENIDKGEWEPYVNGEKDGDEIAGDHVEDIVDDRTPRVGMTFKSYVEVCDFYKQYACRIGFGASVKNSWFTEDGRCRGLVVKCCKGGRGKKGEGSEWHMRTDCKAMIKVNLRADGLLHVSKVILEHNHELSSSTVHFFRCNKILPAAVKKCFALGDEAEIQLDQFSDGNGGKDFVNHVGKMKRLKLGAEDLEATHQFFTHMQIKNSNFFYSMDLNEEGCLRNVFWADAKSRAAYEYFGDIVSVDTTCMTDLYDMPFVSFHGVNHHGQSVLLGCGLLSDETTEAYIWLFEAWLSCMYRHHPNAIITDQCVNMQAAIAHVFPHTRHRLCLWYILKKMPKELGSCTEYKAIEQEFKKAVFDSLRVGEFEEQWAEIIGKHRLEANHWLSGLYASRHLWVPFFLNDTFWAGMSITRSDEVLMFFFEGYIHSNTSLKQFVTNYEMVMQSKYEMEAKADFESFHNKWPLITKFYMEEQLSRFYTLDIFKKFQDEMRGIMYCNVSLVKVSESISTFEVKQCEFIEDGKTVIGYKYYEVLYNAEELEVECICHCFYFKGFLCRHALAVLRLQQVHEIPSRYTLDRWRKDFKQFKALTHSSSDVAFDNEMERYGYLTKQCLRVVELGAKSDNKFQLAIKLVGELEKLLSTCEDGQMLLGHSEVNVMESGNVTKTMPSKSKANDNICDSVQVRRRGRPAQKRKNCNTEKTCKSRRKMANQIGSEESGSEVLHITSTAPHFDTHIGMQGNINVVFEAGGLYAKDRYKKPTTNERSRDDNIDYATFSVPFTDLIQEEKQNGTIIVQSTETANILDVTDPFTTDMVFNSRDEVIRWSRDTGKTVGIIVVIKRSDYGVNGKSPRLTLGCERGGYYRRNQGGRNIKETSRRKRSKRCECPFLLRAIKMPLEDQWMIKVECGTHNHPAI